MFSLRIRLSLKKSIMLNNIIIVLIVILLQAQIICSFVNSPKIVTKDGNLIFHSGLNRNITFQLNGVSRLKINDELDLLDLLESNVKGQGNLTNILHCDDSTQMSVIKNEVINLKSIILGQQGVNDRLQNMRRGVQNRTRLLRNFQNRLQRTETMIRTLKNQISTDNCASNPCQNGGTCFSLFKKFVCKCNKDFEGDSCEKDVNECVLYEGTDLGCQNGAQCINRFGGFSCLCLPGWFGIHCTRRENDCAQSSSWELCAHGVCVNSNNNNGYKCICDQGWTTNTISPACNVDVDECANNNTQCVTRCINLPGSFTCAPCDKGLTGNGLSCRDVDECAIDNGGCSTTPLVPCINTYGSYHCGECPFGWTGDGRSCLRIDSDINIATSCRSNNICHPLASCIEISNSIVCSCPVGMTGIGIGANGCVPIVGVKCDAQPCLNGGTCVNTETGYRCICPRGYVQPNCTPLPNACTPNPCKNNGQCTVQSDDSFVCSCLPSFNGRLCENRANNCGGIIIGETGRLKYPVGSGYGHNEQCAWVLRTNKTLVLNVTFHAFELEDSTDCRFDWLQINDGHSVAAQIIGRFCGTNKPLGGNIISTTNSLYLWFRSDNTTAKEGFDLEWKSIAPVCGGIINATTHGTISSPGSPGKYPKNRDCVWQIRAPINKRIKLSFFSLKLEQHTSCNFDFLEITDAVSKLVVEKYCTTSSPPPVLLPTNEANIRFHSDNEDRDFGFQIFYSLEERMPGCGGVFNAKEGTIMSPSNIKDELSLSCEYEIRALPAESISVEFEHFDMIEGNCIEFYNVNLEKNIYALDNKFCGDYGFDPKPFKSIYNTVLIKYYTKGGYFELNYKSVCEHVFESDVGFILSPGYPSAKQAAQSCLYNIITKPKTVIELNVVDFELNDNTNDEACAFSYLRIKNQDSIGSFCGNNTPSNDLVSKTNMLTLEYVRTSSASGRGFKIEYKTVPMKNEDCGGVYTEPGHLIHPPLAEDSTYLHEKICYWVIMAPPNKHIAIKWEYFQLEDVNDCAFDYVEIYENIANPESSTPFARLCGTTKPPPFVSHSRMLTFKFESDATESDRGFEISYEFVDKNNCGGTIYSSTGELFSPEWPRNYSSNIDCIWVITTPERSQLELMVHVFELEESENCNRDWLSIRNGGSENSSLIGSFCGSRIPNIIPSFTNQLRLHFHTDGADTARGFRLTWKMFSNRCGGVLKGDNGVITSPLYPDPYPHRAECEWHIFVHKGSAIHIKIEDMKIERLSNCKYDSLEIFDGFRIFASSMSKLCELNSDDGVMEFRTTQNEAVIRFQSDATNNERGFYLSYAANCIRTLTDLHGAIESPNYEEENYNNNINCTWTIKAPRGNNIQLEILDIHANNQKDVLYIYDKSSQNTTIHNVSSSGSFKSFGDTLILVQNSSSISFSLEYSVIGCVALFQRSTGNFTSPNHPLPYKNNIECHWEIRVAFGKNIELTISDMDIEESKNCTKDYLQISNHKENAHAHDKYCGKRNEIVVTSSSSRVYISFVSDASNNGKGFTASYRVKDSACGGLMQAKTGVIMSPNYPKNYPTNIDCEWTIIVNEHHRIELKLEEFDIEESEECELDFLETYEISNENVERKIFKQCGSIIAKNIWETTTSIAAVRFHSDESFEAKGFKLSFSELCGNDITVEMYSNFEFTLPLGNSTCKYRLFSKNPDERIILSITHAHLHSSVLKNYVSEEDCQNGGVKIYDGSTENSAVRAKFCKLHPPTITSYGHALTLTIPTALISELEGFLMPLNSFCGGYYNSLSGKFSSPDYPSSYALNMYCEWTIISSLGNSLVLMIEDLNLESSEDCNKDYLEVREEDSRGQLLGIFCGNQMPTPITGSVLWIKFSSDNDQVGTGFLASYNYATHNEINGTKGVIESPRYPTKFHVNTPYSWRITVERDYVIMLMIKHIVDVDVDTFRIYDGYSDIGLSIDLRDKTIIYSSTNILYFTAQRGPFQFEWERFSREAMRENATSMELAEKCGKSLHTIDYRITFNSPGYPKGYENDLNCAWNFISQNPAKHVSMRFLNIDLEHYDQCFADYIEVSSSNNLQNYNLLDKLCDNSGNIMSKTYHGVPYLQMKFVTDSSQNKTGFSASIRTVCGSELTQPHAFVNITTLINRLNETSTECIWQIKVRTSRRIRITFPDSQLNQLTSAANCRNYLLLRNGINQDSPFLGQGKYCNNDINDVLETTANHAYIKFVYGNAPFRVAFRYEEILHECSDTIVLDDEMMSSVLITSPNYPNIPNPHTECVWLVKAPIHRAITANFLGKFDLASVTGPLNISCAREYVQLNDGATELMPLLGQYCGTTKPDVIVSSRNVLRIKYITDVTEPHIGFMLNVSLAICGGTYYANENTITSPTNLYSFAKNKDFECVYIIELERGFSISLVMHKLNLPIAQHCEEVTHLELHEIDTFGERENITDILKICGDYIINERHFIVETNKLVIRYKIKDKDVSQHSFEIKYVGIGSRCGEYIEASLGVLQTPNYPEGVRKYTLCSWHLRAPKGKRFKIEVLDFDTGNSSYTAFGQLRHFNGLLTFANDFNMNSIIMRVANNPPRFIYSTDNTMTIEASLLPYKKHRGFKLRFSAEEDSIMCEEVFKLGAAYSEPKEISFNMTKQNNSTFYCNYELDVPADETLAITFNKYELLHRYMGPINNCRYISPVRLTVNKKQLLPNLFCQNLTAPVARIPFPISMEVFGNKARELKLQYQLFKCGGYILSTEDDTIVAPVMPNNYTGSVQCAWSVSAINYLESSELNAWSNDVQFEVSFQGDFKSICDKQYLLIYKGPTQNSPLLGRYCSQFTSSNNIIERGVFIEYYSEQYDAQSNFSVHVQWGGGCGGELTYPYRKIFFDTQYKNNVECIWNIVADAGYHIGLRFTDRFFIESSKDCTKDYLLVQQQNNKGDWQDIQKLCGRDPPAMVNTTNTVMRLIFRSDAENVGDGFTAEFERNCGAILYATNEEQDVYSPGYPANYDKNLFCNYTILPSSTENVDLQVNFVDLDVEETSIVDCIFDNLTITTFTEYDNTDTVLCGMKKGHKFRSKNRMHIVFRTDDLLAAKGFHFKYSINKCGGLVDKPAVIETPKNDKQLFAMNERCYWNISAPLDQKILLKIENIDFVDNDNCYYNGLKIFRGLETDDNALILNLCGNFTKTLPVLSINSNTAMIHAYSDHSAMNKGFKALVLFVPNCDKNIFLNVQNASYELNTFDRNFKDKYLNCNFVFTTIPGRQFQLQFTNFNLNDSDNCETNYLQLRDGIAIYADEIGKFCGKSIPQELMTSSNALFMHFITTKNATTGFQVQIKSVPTICGQHNLQLPENGTLTIKSPDNGAGIYANNLNCFWSIKSNQYLKLKFIKINIDTTYALSNNSCAGDYIKIFRYEDNNLMEKGYLDNKVFNGHFAIKDYSCYSCEHIYCGTALPHEYYPQSKAVYIKFHTDAAIGKSGFELEISAITKCEQHHDSLHGRIVVEPNETCDIYINVPANYTLTIYYEGIQLYNSDCAEEFLNIFDAHTNKSLHKICGYEWSGRGLYTNTNALHIQLHIKSQPSRVDFSYLASANGPGCGGDVYSTEGLITSPYYPNNARNNSDCRWNIRVPSNSHVLLTFEDFNFGARTTCHSDYLQIIEYDDNTGQELIMRQYCGDDQIKEYKSNKSYLTVRLHKTVNHDGTGFCLKYNAVYANYISSDDMYN